MELRRIEVSRIVEDPDQPRKAIDDAALAGLADSIKQHGVLNPITVAPLTGVDGFRIVTGERRWRASQLAGLYDMPCIVRPEPTADDADKTTEQLIENLQREELAPLDKARAVAALKEKIEATNREVAQRLGLSERTVGYLLDLLELPEAIGEQIVSSPNRPADGNLTEKHGRFLRQLNDAPELQEKLVEKIKADKLSTEDTAKFARVLRDNPDSREDILRGGVGDLGRFGGGGARAGSARAAGELTESEYYAGAYDGGPYAGDQPSPFSASRGIVGIAQRVPATLREIKVSAISADDLPALEDALVTLKDDVERLLAEVRARR
ncbi:MAG TPA: ParB/RepB/Spo0J family partition protein [Armatimonadaceae bacterium]|nr:ParB/RepB/Spo0J family partition protein [Armatimonadaceae bacterium]